MNVKELRQNITHQFNLWLAIPVILLCHTSHHPIPWCSHKPAAVSSGLRQPQSQTSATRINFTNIKKTTPALQHCDFLGCCTCLCPIECFEAYVTLYYSMLVWLCVCFGQETSQSDIYHENKYVKFELLITMYMPIHSARWYI